MVITEFLIYLSNKVEDRSNILLEKLFTDKKIKAIIV